MTARPSLSQIIELDGELLCRHDGRLTPMDDLKAISGDKRLVTDFQEGLSRVMTVDGPVKYAELLVRRKLQEAGEFEEPVHIFTHWKKKRGKATSDVFFTAVPSRLANYYQVELGQQEDITLVYPLYGVLWDVVRRAGGVATVAVVFRHDRFAEVVVGSKHRVLFANRCVAFDTEKEQIDALWETVRSDIESVENEHRIKVARILHLNWVRAEDGPQWPADWQKRLETVEPESLQLDTASCSASLPLAVEEQTAGQSISPSKEKLFYFAKKWAPAVNVGLAVLVVALVAGLIGLKFDAHRLQQRLESIQQEIGQVQTRFPGETLGPDFDKLLKFVGQLDRYRNAPSYQQIVDDVTQCALKQLSLDDLKIDFASDQVRLQLSGKIDAPFETAHSGYQQFLSQMTARGYRVDESRFETQINTSQVVLKLSRPVT
jgi:hypothetical protein